MLKAENTLFYYISLYCDEWILLYNPNTVTVKSINDLYTYRTRKASKEGELSCELLLTWLKKSKLSYKKQVKLQCYVTLLLHSLCCIPDRLDPESRSSSVMAQWSLKVHLYF